MPNEFDLEDADRRSRTVRVLRPQQPFLRSIPGNLAILFAYRNMLQAMTASLVKLRYRQSVLGWVWAILQPLTLMLIYAVIFSHAVGRGATAVPLPLFIMAGVLPWSFCSTAASTATRGMTIHAHLIGKVYFPREILPLSYVVAAFFDIVVALALLAVMMPFYHVSLTWQSLAAIPIVLILAVHTAAFCMFLSIAQVALRDISVGLPLLLQVGMFSAPVVYPETLVPKALSAIYWANPLALLISQFRRAMVGGGPVEFGALAYCAATGLVFFLLSYALFKRFEFKITDAL